MLTLKVTTVGSSAGVVLPKEALARLKVKKGDKLFLLETADGYEIVPTIPSSISRWRRSKKGCGATAMLSASLHNSANAAQGAGLARPGRAGVAVHKKLIAEHGGAQGIRDRGLLKSALARPANLLHHGNPNIFEMAAAYAAGIARNHPFVDANKRASFMAAYIFLVRNGYEPRMTEADTVLVMLKLASGKVTEPRLAAWLSENTRRLQRRPAANPKRR
jgi:death-on-curing protein